MLARDDKRRQEGMPPIQRAIMLILDDDRLDGGDGLTEEEVAARIECYAQFVRR